MVTPVISNPATPDKLPTSAPMIPGTYIYTPILPAVVTAGVNQVTTVTSAQNAMTGTTKTVQTTTTPSVPTNSPSTTNVEEKPVLGQGTTLAPGLHKMKVVFIPTDTTTYEPVETEVEILVQAETKVIWVDPAPIKKTTPVGPGQLNATGTVSGLSNNVPGTYKYDIPEGTTLPPGKYPVKVTFTPTDPNYLPSSGEVIVTVIADINPVPTPIVTPANTASAKPITNTTSSASSKVIAIGNGLSSVVTNGMQVSVLPQLNFSGKTTVTVSVTDEGETKDVVVPVTVLPLPAVTPLTTPNTKGKSTIAWKPSPNAVEYEVTLAGKSICTTTMTSCSTAALIGPSSDVKVVAKGNDETVAPVAPAKYTAPKKPVTALVVYFDTNKFNLDAKDKADIRAIAKVIIEQGFKNIVVNGHTDIRGGVDNQVLSRNRSNATFNYLKELVPGLNVTIGAFASTKPAVKGTSAEALASNRRAEVGVY
jgi:outer membrane protein OmpA-like peptidoglycan-associated protein